MYPLGVLEGASLAMWGGVQPDLRVEESVSLLRWLGEQSWRPGSEGKVRSRFPAVIRQNLKVSLGGKGGVEGGSQEDSLPTCQVRKLKEPVGQAESGCDLG